VKYHWKNAAFSARYWLKKEPANRRGGFINMDINVRIEAPALTDAIHSLATAIAGNIELLIPSTKQGTQILPPMLDPAIPASITQIAPTVNPEIVPPVIAPAQQAGIPVGTPVATPTTPGPVPTTAPVTPQPQTITPPAEVPTTVQNYTIDQLAVAATQLVDTGRRNDLVNLLAKYGVQALTVLPKEQYGAFATDLRAMGAKI
jgi:hypothetical protein